MFHENVLELLWKEADKSESNCQANDSVDEQTLSVTEFFDVKGYEEVKATISIISKPGLPAQESDVGIPRFPRHPNDIFEDLLRRILDRDLPSSTNCEYETHCYPKPKGGKRCIRYCLCTRK